MGRSQHSKWMTTIDGKQRIFRTVDGQFDVLEYEKYPYIPDQVDKVSKSIRSNLTDDIISKKLKKKYPKNYFRWKYPFFGHCIPATFVLLYLMDTEILEPIRGENSEGEGHWWLRDSISEEKHDLTFDQFPCKKELESVYATGEAKGFYEFDEMPDARFFDLIQKIQPNSKRWKADNYCDTPFSYDEFLIGRAHESLY